MPEAPRPRLSIQAIQFLQKQSDRFGTSNLSKLCELVLSEYQQVLDGHIIPASLVSQMPAQAQEKTASGQQIELEDLEINW